MMKIGNSKNKCEERFWIQKDGYRYRICCELFSNSDNFSDKSGYREKEEKHFELAIVYGFKGMFYWYSALMNFISFFNQTWSEKYIVGFAIGLAILEGTNGMLECYEECLKMQEKNRI